MNSSFWIIHDNMHFYANTYLVDQNRSWLSCSNTLNSTYNFVNPYRSLPDRFLPLPLQMKSCRLRIPP